MKKNSISWLILPFFAFGIGALQAQDWPMWRYDAHRSAASLHDLPAELHLPMDARITRCARSLAE